MKLFDVLIGALILVGALNWGLVGMFQFNLVSTLFGEMSVMTRTVYALVGLAAVYDIVAIKAIWKRWHIAPFSTPHTA